MGIAKTISNFRTLSGRFSTQSLTSKASLNALASTIDYGARIAIEFALNPFLVAGLGSYLFGMWRILWRLNGYLFAASGRSAQALKFATASRQASTDFDEKRTYVGSSIAVWIIFLPVLAITGALLTWLMPIALAVPQEYMADTRWAIGLLSANGIMLSLADIPRAVLQGENLGYKRMGLSAIFVLATGGLMALAVHWETGLAGLATANLLITILSGLFFIQIVRAYVPWFGIARPSRETIRWFLGLSWWFIIWKLVVQLMEAGDILILGLFNSVESVTAYSLTRYIPDATIRLVAIFVFGIAPGLGGVIGSGNLRKAANVRGEIMAFTWLLATVAGTVALLWNQSFVTLWVGPGYDIGPISTLAIIVMIFQYTLIRNDSNIIDLTLDIHTKVIMGVLSVALSMGLAWILIDYFEMGIVGLCVGFIGGRIVLSVTYPMTVGHSLQISLSSQVKAAVRPFLVTAVLFGASLAIRSILDPQIGGWWELVVATGLSALLIMVLAIFAGLPGEQRRRLWRRGQAITELVKGAD
jgi:O-antigen/teichoic acid export membrane protein